MPSKPQGVYKLNYQAKLIAGLMPATAIGGIKLHNVGGVMASGIGSAALITGITDADDPLTTAVHWLQAVGPGDEERV